jgi:integrase
MCRNPLYFFKSKHGVYQFRYSFPLQLCNNSNIQREIKISLRSKDRDIAIRRHYFVYLQVQALAEELKRIIMSESNSKTVNLQGVIEQHKKKIILDDNRLFTESLIIENATLVIEKNSYELQIANKNKTINMLSSSVSKPTNSVTSVSLAHAIAEYVAFQADKKVWNDGGKRQSKSYLSVFADIIGQNVDISLLNKDNITIYQRTLRKLPKNVNKLFERPNDITLRPSHYKQIADSHNREKLSARGLESHFNRVKPFLSWCVDTGYLTQDHRKILAIGKREIQKTKVEVLPFSYEHLVKMFTSYIYSEYCIPREKPNAFHFWMPLLGLFTGARESEIATLRLSDIKIIDDVLCIDINDEHKGKTLKTAAARRDVPLAQSLIDAGFVSYLETRKRESKSIESTLFELPDHRDGVTRAVSKWFNENFKNKCELATTGKTKVCFHSFRHTLINKLGSTKIGNDLVPDRIVKEIVGHEMGDVTNDVYGHNHDIALKKEAIDSVDFGIDLSKIHYSIFIKRNRIKKQ